jgi:hypothetical protein
VSESASRYQEVFPVALVSASSAVLSQSSSVLLESQISVAPGLMAATASLQSVLVVRAM